MLDIFCFSDKFNAGIICASVKKTSTLQQQQQRRFQLQAVKKSSRTNTKNVNQLSTD
jgi:hypothetical protein